MLQFTVPAVLGGVPNTPLPHGRDEAVDVGRRDRIYEEREVVLGRQAEVHQEGLAVGDDRLGGRALARAGIEVDGDEGRRQEQLEERLAPSDVAGLADAKLDEAREAVFDGLAVAKKSVASPRARRRSLVPVSASRVISPGEISTRRPYALPRTDSRDQRTARPASAAHSRALPPQASRRVASCFVRRSPAVGTSVGALSHAFLREVGDGAGGGNRTRVSCLEGRRCTIELRLRLKTAASERDYPRACR